MFALISFIPNDQVALPINHYFIHILLLLLVLSPFVFMKNYYCYCDSCHLQPDDFEAILEINVSFIAGIYQIYLIYNY